MTALEVFYENALYKFTFDIDIDIDRCSVKYTCLDGWMCPLKRVRPLSTVGYTSVVAGVIHSRQWSN